uniref:Uncharacterized protein n=1 Tax=Arundo donax TaxID=35708 RepID=A0A0A9C1C0_ARUDO
MRPRPDRRGRRIDAGKDAAQDVLLPLLDPTADCGGFRSGISYRDPNPNREAMGEAKRRLLFGFCLLDRRASSNPLASLASPSPPPVR